MSYFDPHAQAQANGYQHGRIEGERAGFRNGQEQGYQAGHADGHALGYDKGWNDCVQVANGGSKPEPPEILSPQIRTGQECVFHGKVARPGVKRGNGKIAR